MRNHGSKKPFGTFVFAVAALCGAGCFPSIEGRVEDWATGEPVAGAEVSLWDSECDWDLFLFIPLPTDCRTWVVAQTLTDAEGRYALDDFPRNESLELRVQKQGYQEFTRVVSVGSGTRIVNVQLRPIPPSPPQNLAARMAREGIELTWTNPTEANFAGVMLVRYEGDSCPDSRPEPAAGQSYTPGQPLGPGRVVFAGRAESFVDHDVRDGSTYWYEAFSYSDVLVYSSGGTLTSAECDMTPPAAPTLVALVPQPAWVEVRWVAPDDAAGILIVRSVGEPVAATPETGVAYGPGQALGSGTVVETAYVDTTGVERRTWDTDPPVGAYLHYTLFAYDEAYNYSAGASGGLLYQPIVEWFSGPPLDARRVAGAAATDGTHLLLSGGYDETSAHADVVGSTIGPDGAPGPWFHAGDLPAGRGAHASAVTGGYYYVIGGADDRSVARAEVFVAPIADGGMLGPFAETAPLPAPRWGLAAAVHEGRIYVIGGWDGEVGCGDVFSAAPEPDGRIAGWRREVSLPGPRASHAAVVIRGVIYVIGGVGGTGDLTVLGDVLAAPVGVDGTLDSWRSAGELPEEAGVYDLVAVAHGDYLFILGGTNRRGAPTDSVHYAHTGLDGSLVEWAEALRLPLRQQRHAGVTAGGRVYWFGGSEFGGTAGYYAALP